MTHVVISGPPLVIFTVCLAAFGCTMIILAHLVGEKEYPNPDVHMDWNKLFKRVSNLKLCHFSNDTHYTEKEERGPHSTSRPVMVFNSSFLQLVDESKSLSAVLTDVVDRAKSGDSVESDFTEVSVRVRFQLYGKLPSSHFSLKGTLKGKMLGFTGKLAYITYNISLSFRPLHSTNSSCEGRSQCSPMYDVCLTMSLPQELLPRTKHPAECAIEQFSSPIFLPINFSEIGDESQVCFGLSYTPDVKLTEMLSAQDRSIVNLHLMHTSYFMFVMVITLVGYSLIKARLRQTKNYVILQKSPEDA